MKSNQGESCMSTAITPVIQINVKIDFDLRDIVGGDLGDRLVLVFNPQWQTGGQILSDFG